MKKRFADEQIVGFLREAEVGRKTVEQLARELEKENACWPIGTWRST